MNKKIITFSILAIFLVIVLAGCSRNAKEKSTKKNNEPDTLPKISSLNPGDYKYFIMQGKTKRYFLLHVPKSYDSKSASLILVFHGGLGNAERTKENYGWIEKSNEEGFIVAFPNGASRFNSGKKATWNAGNCCGYAVESNSDDVGFVKSIIKDIKNKVAVNKIFATGFSNGGMFSYRLACEMSDIFSAVAAVSGTNNYDSCNPKQPISIMHIHGLLDQHVLFGGGYGPDSKTKVDYTSVPDTISYWVKKNNCNSNPERVFENENGYCDLYSGCNKNVQVKLCVAKDGGHSWTGTVAKPNALVKTVPSQAFSATDMIWNFFKTK